MWLELLRRAWGGPVIVNSGRRCASRNLKVGGAPSSRHLIGCAADVRAADAAEGRRFRDLAERLCRQPGWEFLPYETFVHIAAPREEAERLWDGGGITL